MIGGVLGLVGMIGTPVPESLTGPDVILVLLIAGLYILALVAGILLWRDTRLGHNLSIIVQLVQLPKIASSAIAFMINFTFDLSVLAIDLPAPASYTLTVQSQAGSKHMLFIGNPTIPFGIGFSIVSCIFLAKLLKKRTPVAENMEDAELQDVAPADWPVADGR